MNKADAGELLSQCNGRDVKGQEVSTCPNHQGGCGRAESSRIPALNLSYEAPPPLETHCTLRLGSPVALHQQLSNKLFNKSFLLC